MFAPVYRPSEGQQTLLARQHRREQRKRRRGVHDIDSSDDDQKTYPKSQEAASDSGSEHDVRTHSVSRTDPYHVAGYSREAPLPPAPFPHKDVKSAARSRPIEEEAASLKPPLYLPKTAVESQPASLKRKHVENLTTTLHTCMLRGDWQRAARAWALLLRIEIAGRGMDLRQHGRWGIGAEILMRSDQENSFTMVREYYDRLILQYPHTPRAQHAISALAFYPALFNIWIYAAQNRYQKGEQQTANQKSGSSSGTFERPDEDVSMTSLSSHSSADRALKKQELSDALPIAQRMDEILLSPPYDASRPLLRIRGMLGLWLSDLYYACAGSLTSDNEDSGAENADAYRRSRQQGDDERKKALHLFRKMQREGDDLSQSILDLIASENDKSDD